MLLKSLRRCQPTRSCPSQPEFCTKGLKSFTRPVSHSQYGKSVASSSPVKQSRNRWKKLGELSLHLGPTGLTRNVFCDCYYIFVDMNSGLLTIWFNFSSFSPLKFISIFCISSSHVTKNWSSSNPTKVILTSKTRSWGKVSSILNEPVPAWKPCLLVIKTSSSLKPPIYSLDKSALRSSPATTSYMNTHTAAVEVESSLW